MPRKIVPYSKELLWSLFYFAHYLTLLLQLALALEISVEAKHEAHYHSQSNCP